MFAVRGAASKAIPQSLSFQTQAIASTARPSQIHRAFNAANPNAPFHVKASSGCSLLGSAVPLVRPHAVPSRIRLFLGSQQALASTRQVLLEARPVRARAPPVVCAHPFHPAHLTTSSFRPAICLPTNSVTTSLSTACFSTRSFPSATRSSRALQTLHSSTSAKQQIPASPPYQCHLPLRIRNLLKVLLFGVGCCAGSSAR
jgi:hypothetical protein